VTGRRFRPWDIVSLLCSSLLVLSFLFPDDTNANVTKLLAVKEWRGEYFKKKEGGLFLKTSLVEFAGVVTSNVQVTLFGIIQQQYYTFSNTQVALSAAPREIWKLPSGKYRLERVELIDHAGVRRTWAANPNSKVAVLVPRVMVSNLGLWTIKPLGSNGLSIKFQMIANTYSEKSAAKDSSVAAVVNGFTGSVQKVIGGKKVIEGADRDYSDDKTLRATASFTRQIGMYYRVDMFKHNKYAKDIMSAISAFDPKIRQCYTSALNQNSLLKGDLVFQVVASAKTGTIRQARKSKGSISDGGMIDCIIEELGQIPMPIQENMLGELTFIFETK
jgi:hypothetical protein